MFNSPGGFPNRKTARGRKTCGPAMRARAGGGGYAFTSQTPTFIYMSVPVGDPHTLKPQVSRTVCVRKPDGRRQFRARAIVAPTAARSIQVAMAAIAVPCASDCSGATCREATERGGMIRDMSSEDLERFEPKAQ